MMTVQYLRKAIRELKEVASTIPHRESLEAHTTRLKTAMQGYADAGIFGEGGNLEINVVRENDLPEHLIRRWESRHSLTVDELIRLYYEIGFFSRVDV
jgi:hypothetical protein